MGTELSEIQLKLELLKRGGKCVTVKLKGFFEADFVLETARIEISNKLILLHNSKGEYIISLHLGRVVGRSMHDNMIELHFDSRN